MFGQTDGARIASGMGGTVNLIASVLFVVGVLVIMGALSARAAALDSLSFDRSVVLSMGGVVLLSLAASGSAMRLGARHLREAEF